MSDGDCKDVNSSAPSVATYPPLHAVLMMEAALQAFANQYN